SSSLLLRAVLTDPLASLLSAWGTRAPCPARSSTAAARLVAGHSLGPCSEAISLPGLQPQGQPASESSPCSGMDPGRKNQVKVLKPHAHRRTRRAGRAAVILSWSRGCGRGRGHGRGRGETTDGHVHVAVAVDDHVHDHVYDHVNGRDLARGFGVARGYL